MSKELAKLMVELSFDACQGTVTPRSDFNAEKDSEALRKAMKGLGTNEKAIIEVAAKRTNKERIEIRTQYKQMFGRDLMSDLKSEIGGNFRDLTLALFTPAAMYDAQSLYGAIKGAGTTESTLVEILASRSNEQIKEIKEVYKREYHHDLEKDLIGDTSGDFRKLLVSLNNASREESRGVDEGLAKADAEILYKAGEKKTGTDEAAFNKIFCSRSFPQLRATFRAYQKIANKDIAKSVSSEFSGDIEDGLQAIIQIARCAPLYFAHRLQQSMKGAGTKDSALIRVVVSRSEVDMVQIKEVFPKLYKSSLEKWIEGDTSGDYKKLLLALVK